MTSAVAYYRVSTQRQGRSGWASRRKEPQSCDLPKPRASPILQEFTEIGTGKGADALDRRPQLATALASARLAKCPVVVAKLDRLSRDVAFIAGLMAQRIPSSWRNSAPMPIRSCFTFMPRWLKRNGG